MSLPGKEFRFEAPADHHAALKAFAEANGQDLGDYMRVIVAEKVASELHRHTVIHAALSRAGIVPELVGVARKPKVAGEAT